MLELSKNCVLSFTRVHRVEVARLGVRDAETIFRNRASFDGGNECVLSALCRNYKLLLAGLIFSFETGYGLRIQAKSAILTARTSLLDYKLVGSLSRAVVPNVHVCFLGLGQRLSDRLEGVLTATLFYALLTFYVLALQLNVLVPSLR